jgi:hypothetical protein
MARGILTRAQRIEQIRPLFEDNYDDYEIAQILGISKNYVVDLRWQGGMKGGPRNVNPIPEEPPFNYKEHLDAMLAEITERTGITDFQSYEGQTILHMINRSLYDEKYWKVC